MILYLFYLKKIKKKIILLYIYTRIFLLLLEYILIYSNIWSQLYKKGNFKYIKKIDNTYFKN